MKYRVHIYYSGSVCLDVDADSHEEALQLAYDKIDDMDDSTFMTELNPDCEGHDVYPIKVKEK